MSGAQLKVSPNCDPNNVVFWEFAQGNNISKSRTIKSYHYQERLHTPQQEQLILTNPSLLRRQHQRAPRPLQPARSWRRWRQHLCMPSYLLCCWWLIGLLQQSERPQPEPGQGLRQFKRH